MNTLVKCMIASIVSGVTCSFITYKYMEEKKNRIMKEEVDYIRNYYMNKSTNTEKYRVKDGLEEEQTNNIPIEKPASIKEYVSVLEKTKYRQEGDSDPEYLYGASECEPFVISYDEFGEKEDDGYDLITLYYYNNHILTDDNDIPVSVSMTVGEDALLKFDEYEEDTLYVRNPVTKAEYEVLLVDEFHGG